MSCYAMSIGGRRFAASIISTILARARAAFDWFLTRTQESEKLQLLLCGCYSGHFHFGASKPHLFRL
jgi:hypothetical protein